MRYENILEDLYHGEINPNVKCFNQDSDYARLMKIISDNESKLIIFLKGLSKAQEEQQLFLRLIDAQIGISEINELERFIEDFQLGARFMLDTFIIPRKSALENIC